MALLLSSCLALCAACQDAAGTGQSKGGVWEKAVAVGNLAKGSVLACFVWRGMTEAQVERLLGEPYGVYFRATGTTYVYPKYGIVVLFSYNVMTDGKYDFGVAESWFSLRGW